MSDAPKKPDESTETKESSEKISDLPTKEINDRDAQAVKGGLGSVKYLK
jgi:hypothetical protein